MNEPWGRSKTASLLIFWFGLTAMATALFGDMDEEESGLAIALRVIVVLIGGLMMVGGLYRPFNRLETEISEHQVFRVRTWFGIPIKRQMILTADVDRLEIWLDGAMNKDGRSIVDYRLMMVGKDDFFPVLDEIPNKPLVEAIRSEILRVTSIDD